MRVTLFISPLLEGQNFLPVPTFDLTRADEYISSVRYLRGRIQWMTFYFPFQQRSFSVQTLRNFKCHRMTLYRDIKDEMAVLDVKLISDRWRGEKTFFHILQEKLG